MKNKKFIQKILLYISLLIFIAFIIIFIFPKCYIYISNIEENKLVKNAELNFNKIKQALENENNKDIKECQIQKNGDLICDDFIEIKTQLTSNSTYSGFITLNETNVIDVKIFIDNNVFIKNSKNKLELVHELCEAVTSSTTGNVPKGEYISGDEYICEVKKGTKYTFFVLSTNEDDTINLILDRNIYYDELLNISSLSSSNNKSNKKKKGLIQWGGYRNGPYRVMNYVYNATKDWYNVPNIKINYNNTLNDTKNNFIYSGIKTIGDMTSIIKYDGTPSYTLTNIGGYENLKARVPYKEELSNFDNNNLWMYNYLSNSSKVSGEGLKNIDGIYGYWTFSQNIENSNQAWWLSYNGILTVNHATTNYYGIRPVITISKDNIK